MATAMSTPTISATNRISNANGAINMTRAHDATLIHVCRFIRIIDLLVGQAFKLVMVRLDNHVRFGSLADLLTKFS